MKTFLSVKMMLKKCMMPLLIIVLFGLGASTTYAATSWIDKTKLAEGAVGVQATQKGKRLKVMIQKGDGKYTYDLLKSNEYEYFSLQLGDGSYKITLLENTTGTKYKMVNSTTVDVKLTQITSPYTQSIQCVSWTDDYESIKTGKSLTEKAKNKDETTDIIYQNVVKNYRYDYNKLATLPSTYLPSIEATYIAKTGICYDFSSLYAAVLRSQGIPTKLVKGYTPNAEGYHAWNEVYDESTKSWYIIDTTYDLQVIAKNPKVLKKKEAKLYQKVYEY